MCLLFFTLLALGQGGINQFLVVALNALYGTPVAAATLALTSYLFGTAGGILIGGHVADRTRHHNRVAAFCFLLTAAAVLVVGSVALPRSEEHTSELQSLMPTSYAVFCFKKK